ncbi:MAG: preprotein translocase subunit YajC [Saprospiraceae bacterium]|jgi:preprotein translocase subunit YajC|nr:preprotein translocase subunit YajC [Saprospiraceae bacterium]
MFFLLQASATGSSSWINLIFIVSMFLVFWLLMIRPQAKRQKEQKLFQESLDKNKDVVTSSGILGRISKIEDTIVTLEVSPKVYIRVTKNAISKELTENINATIES